MLSQHYCGRLLFPRYTQVNMPNVPTEELDNMREKHETEMGLFLREQDRQAARTRGDLQVSNCQRCRPAYPTSLVPFMSSVTACHFGEMLLYVSTAAEYNSLRKLHEASRRGVFIHPHMSANLCGLHTSKTGAAQCSSTLTCPLTSVVRTQAKLEARRKQRALRSLEDKQRHALATGATIS